MEIHDDMFIVSFLPIMQR